MSAAIATKFHRRFKLLRFRYNRFTRRFSAALHVGKAIIGTLALLAATVCLVCLVIYFGYDHPLAEKVNLLRLIRACQIVFIVNVLYDLVLLMRETIANSRVLKWIVDTAILLSVVPLVYPEPARPWVGWLADMLYSRTFLFVVLAAYSTVEVCYGLMKITARRTNPSLLMSGSFLFFILIGSFVLMLPKCTVGSISYLDSLFVTTSAVCITGLTTVDVAATFTPTGLTVLAFLMQIGGLGVLTFTCFFALFFSGANSVYNQLLVRDLIYSKTMNALVPTLVYVLGFTLVIEAAGAAAIYFVLPPGLAADTSGKILLAGFHSLSSFCNAGFTCIDGGMSNPALMTPGQSVYLITSALIFAGAIGFPILVNFRDILFGHFRRMIARVTHRQPDVPVHLFDLNTKLVLATSVGLLVFCSAAFFVCEYNNTLSGMSLWQKVVQSVFNSLIPRSAGFASVNPASFLNITMLLIVVQMWIGGASQSLGGGIKVNTVAVVALNVRSIVTGRRRAWAYDRALSIASVRRANAVVALAMAAFILFMAIELLLEPQLGLKELTFEVTSALFTVGSSLGITPQLSAASKITLCVAMFLGRVGLISLLSGICMSHRDMSGHFPEENVIIN